jgi:hypothetical protein
VSTQLQHIRVELDNAQHTLEKLHDGIDHVLDALAIIKAEQPGALELTYALADLRSAYTLLENEIEGGEREGGAP